MRGTEQDPYLTRGRESLERFTRERGALISPKVERHFTTQDKVHDAAELGHRGDFLPSADVGCPDHFDLLQTSPLWALPTLNFDLLAKFDNAPSEFTPACSPWAAMTDVLGSERGVGTEAVEIANFLQPTR